MKQNKKTKLTRKKKVLLIILISVLALILILIFLNLILRKNIELVEEQKQALLLIFPEEHLNTIKFYSGGLISLGSSRVLCDSVYFNEKDVPEIFNLGSPAGASTLVHEVFHTYQARRGCISVVLSSLSNQFVAWLKHGNRNYAYYYSINDTSFNKEQEAMIVEDYFYIKYLDGSIDYTFCTDCQNYYWEDFEALFNKIMEKYK